VLMRASWLEAYDFATGHGAQFLGDYARSADPFANIGERTVSVQVTSVVRASDRSFQVKWTETVYERGSQAGTSHWTAMVTVVVKPPTSAETLRKNPLGLYVDAIDWSRELETPTSSSVTSPPPPPASKPSPIEQTAPVPDALPIPNPDATSASNQEVQ
jgi:type IV secretory pathway TrbF-like protein